MTPSMEQLSMKIPIDNPPHGKSPPFPYNCYKLIYAPSFEQHSFEGIKVNYIQNVLNHQIDRPILKIILFFTF